MKRTAKPRGLGHMMGGGVYQMTGRVRPVYLLLVFKVHQE